MSKIQTYEEFRKDRDYRLSRPAIDKNYTAKKFMDESVENKYFYNFEWMGLPIIQFPQDLMALQEIIWKTQPDNIIETGLAMGGSHAFYASMLNMLPISGLEKRSVISIELKIMPDVIREVDERLEHFVRTKVSSTFIQDDSTSNYVKDYLRKFKGKRNMVCLDSAHWKAHVEKEIDFYHELVDVGCYLVVFDTFVEHRQPYLYEGHTCSPGNSAMGAVFDFIIKRNDFIIDTEIDRKLLISSNVNGYLKRIK